tara:strand:+ start:9062 stop:9424 length:363 start_codon:yes stop_codon:yes gene_type:complete
MVMGSISSENFNRKVGNMKSLKIARLGLALATAFIATPMAPAFAGLPTPHIYNRGVHGHMDLVSAEQLLVRCPGREFGQLYLGNVQSKNEHFKQTGIVPGGYYGRQDRARLERCAHRNQQ